MRISSGLDEALVNLAFDAETSGGLLIVVAAGDAARLERELRARGLPVHAIGECLTSSGALIELA